MLQDFSLHNGKYLQLKCDMHMTERVKTRVHYGSKVAPFSKLVLKQLRLSFTPSRPVRNSGGCSVSPSGLYTPGQPPAGLRAVFNKLGWRHKCQRPCQIKPLRTLSFTGQPACGRVVTLRSTLTWRGWPGITQSVYRLGYDLDSPGFGTRWGGLEISSSSERPDQLWGSLGLPFKGHRGSFPRVKAPWRVMSGAVHLLPLYTCMVWTRTSKFYLSF